MKKTLFLFFVALLLNGILCLAWLPNNVSAQQDSTKKANETLNNDSIIQMVNAGLSESIVVAKIKASNGSFDTSAATLQALKKKGVSDAVILAMVQKTSGTDVSPANPAPASVAIPAWGVLGNAPFSGNASAGSVTIPDGTEIKIVTTEDISGQKVAEGDPLTFKVSEDVKVNGATVIAKDTIVKGTVSNAKKKGMMGKSGELSVRIDSTQAVDGQKIKLRATKSGEGGDNMGSTVALTVLFGPIGLLRHGKEAKIKAGTVLSAYTDETATVSLSR
ncbi:MAG: hypothetical protein ACR2GD_03250 [Pyrinomonadaceae bacterium]